MCTNNRALWCALCCIVLCRSKTERKLPAPVSPLPHVLRSVSYFLFLIIIIIITIVNIISIRISAPLACNSTMITNWGSAARNHYKELSLLPCMSFILPNVIFVVYPDVGIATLLLEQGVLAETPS